jgi:hypothetical protein
MYSALPVTRYVYSQIAPAAVAARTAHKQTSLAFRAAGHIV